MLTDAMTPTPTVAPPFGTLLDLPPGADVLALVSVSSKFLEHVPQAVQTLEMLRHERGLRLWVIAFDWALRLGPALLDEAVAGQTARLAAPTASNTFEHLDACLGSSMVRIQHALHGRLPQHVVVMAAGNRPLEALPTVFTGEQAPGLSLIVQEAYRPRWVAPGVCGQHGVALGHEPELRTTLERRALCSAVDQGLPRDRRNGERVEHTARAVRSRL